MMTKRLKDFSAEEVIFLLKVDFEFTILTYNNNNMGLNVRFVGLCSIAVTFYVLICSSIPQLFGRAPFTQIPETFNCLH